MSRHVVITGGGTGIGRETAKRFAAAGDRVVICGRRDGVLRDTAKAIGPLVTPVAFDASDPASIENSLAALPSRIHVIVHAAGTNLAPVIDAGSLSGLREQWLSNYTANVLPTVLVTRALVDRLPEGGRVIALGSMAARTGGGSYGAAKLALEAWAATTAFEVGPHGITVNVVAPGLTDDTEFFPQGLPASVRENLLAKAANHRAASPADIAATIAFVASPEASHITGQVIPVNGGAHLYR